MSLTAKYNSTNQAAAYCCTVDLRFCSTTHWNRGWYKLRPRIELLHYKTYLEVVVTLFIFIQSLAAALASLLVMMYITKCQV